MNYNGTQAWGETDAEAEEREGRRSVFGPQVFSADTHKATEETTEERQRAEQEKKEGPSPLERVLGSLLILAGKRNTRQRG